MAVLCLHHRDNFYPRPPRGGRPALCELDAALNKISIHALREEGDQVKPIFVVADLISIHALREEGDPTCSQMARRNVLFLSTPSARRATDTARRLKLDDIISIHALREEGDSSWTSCCCR